MGGTDSSCGAGIAADLRTIAAHGCRGSAAITAVIAQNRFEVSHLLPMPPDLVIAQIESVIAEVDVVKIGAVISPEIASAIEVDCPIVLDPVVAATSGGLLVQEGTLEVLKTHLIPKATVITPNQSGAGQLVGEGSVEEMAMRLLELGPQVVVITDEGNDYVASEAGVEMLRCEHIAAQNSRGAGCTFASAIACNLAIGHSPIEAIRRAKQYITKVLSA